MELVDGAATVASGSTSTAITKAGAHAVTLTLTGLGKPELWSPSTPKLYTVRTTLTDQSGTELHSLDVRTGFRQAEFKLDGFHLNGKPFKLFGLNRHQLFPYLGMAANERLQRRDAELLKTTLNCNMVRCSHYPQSPHFLDACDELGLMVWEEPPGWQYVGTDQGVPGPRRAERPRHGDARPQSTLGHRLGDAIERDGQPDSAVQANASNGPAARQLTADERGDAHLLHEGLGAGRVRIRRLQPP